MIRINVISMKTVQLPMIAAFSNFSAILPHVLLTSKNYFVSKLKIGDILMHDMLNIFGIPDVSRHPLMWLQFVRVQLHLCLQLFPYQGYLQGVVHNEPEYPSSQSKMKWIVHFYFCNMLTFLVGSCYFWGCFPCIWLQDSNILTQEISYRV